MAKTYGRSFGVELELGNVDRRTATDIELRKLKITGNHDASIESPVRFWNNIKVLEAPDSIARNLAPQVNGVELVGGVYNDDEINPLELFKIMTKWAAANGEISGNERCGIHYHITFPYDHEKIISALALAMHMEDVFFYVGTMGYKFRGESNNSIYCRPITKKGPVVVTCFDEDLRPSFSPEECIKSKNIDEFWYRYGDSRNNSNRYIPVRYHWINFIPVAKQESLEFRIFNATLNPHHMWAALELCRAFCYVVLNSDSDVITDLPQNSIFNKRSRNDIIETMNSILNRANVDFRVQKYLERIISNAPDINLKNEWTITHLRRYTQPWEGKYVKYAPNTVDKDDVVVPTFVDIHNINNNDGGIRFRMPELRRELNLDFVDQPEQDEIFERVVRPGAGEDEEDEEFDE